MTRIWAHPLAPADDDRCGWLAVLPPARERPRLTCARSVDFAVLGAGFAGLAAARELALRAPTASVAVVDAQRAGWGASGRASGFVVDLAHFVARLAPPNVERYLRLARAGIADLRSRVIEDGIACDWDETGWAHVAATEAGATEVAKLERWLASRGEAFERLDRAGLEKLTGSTFYRAGLRLPGSALVQAGALVRGLADHLPASVELFEESPVRSLRREAGSWVLATAAGELRCRQLLVTVNGYSRQLPGLARRIVPLLTFGSWTRPLTTSEQARLGGEREWGLLAEDAMGSTVRRTRDQRILVRNTVHFDPRYRASEAVRSHARAEHRRAFEARFPMLTEVPFEHTWAGVMGTTPARVPFFGPLAPGVLATGGFTGAGIAMGTVLGRLLAEQALAGPGGEPSALTADALALCRPPRLPPEPLLRWGAGWRTRQMNRNAARLL
jgi:glycine/D-amino acid oxidase-like deaminating enzyme